MQKFSKSWQIDVSYKALFLRDAYTAKMLNYQIGTAQWSLYSIRANRCSVLYQYLVNRISRSL